MEEEVAGQAEAGDLAILNAITSMAEVLGREEDGEVEEAEVVGEGAMRGKPFLSCHLLNTPFDLPT